MFGSALTVLRIGLNSSYLSSTQFSRKSLGNCTNPTVPPDVISLHIDLVGLRLAHAHKAEVAVYRLAGGARNDNGLRLAVEPRGRPLLDVT